MVPVSGTSIMDLTDSSVPFLSRLAMELTSSRLLTKQKTKAVLNLVMR